MCEKPVFAERCEAKATHKIKNTKFEIEPNNKFFEFLLLCAIINS